MCELWFLARLTLERQDAAGLQNGLHDEFDAFLIASCTCCHRSCWVYWLEDSEGSFISEGLDKLCHLSA